MLSTKQKKGGVYSMCSNSKPKIDQVPLNAIFRIPRMSKRRRFSVARSGFSEGDAAFLGLCLTIMARTGEWSAFCFSDVLAEINADPHRAAHLDSDALKWAIEHLSGGKNEILLIENDCFCPTKQLARIFANANIACYYL